MFSKEIINIEFKNLGNLGIADCGLWNADCGGRGMKEQENTGQAMENTGDTIVRKWEMQESYVRVKKFLYLVKLCTLETLWRLPLRKTRN